MSPHKMGRGDQALINCHLSFQIHNIIFEGSTSTSSKGPKSWLPDKRIRGDLAIVVSLSP